MGDFIGGRRRLLDRRKLLLDASRLFLRGGADFGGSGVEVARHIARLHRQLPQPSHHRVERSAEAAQLIMPRACGRRREIALSHHLSETHVARQWPDDRALDEEGHQQTQQGRAGCGDNQRSPARIVNELDPPLPGLNADVERILGLPQRDDEVRSQ